MLTQPSQRHEKWKKVLLSALLLGAVAALVVYLLSPSQHFEVEPQDISQETAVRICPYVLISEAEYAYIDRILAEEAVQAALADTETMTTLSEELTARYADEFLIDGEATENFTIRTMSGYLYVSGETANRSCIFVHSSEGELGKIVGEYVTTKNFFGEKVKPVYLLENYNNTRFVENVNT